MFCWWCDNHQTVKQKPTDYSQMLKMISVFSAIALTAPMPQAMQDDRDHLQIIPTFFRTGVFEKKVFCTKGRR